MKKIILGTIAALMVGLFCPVSSQAQDLSNIDTYFKTALASFKVQGTQGLQLVITVTNKPDKDGQHGFVAYGEANIEPKGGIGIIKGSGVPLATNSSVKYWLSDRIGLNCPTPPSAGVVSVQTVNQNFHFNYGNTETGTIVYVGGLFGTPNTPPSKPSIILFSQWGWKLKSAYIIGNLLFGTLENGNAYSIMALPNFVNSGR